MSNKKEHASSSYSMDIDSEDEWEEESNYMIMDLGSDLTIDLLKRSLEINNGYSIIGLDTDQPMFKIGNFVYKGEVDYSLGTDLIFEVDESKINKEKDNLESSIHPSNASLKQSSSVYSYLTGEDPSKSSQGLPLIPLTQTTKKMVFHSVLLEQKDDELSGKDKLPDSLLPNLSPNTLFMNKDAILNSMATGDVSPISVSGGFSPSKTKTIQNITLMDAVSDIVDEKSKENKNNKPINDIDLDSAETSQIFNPEMSNVETTEFGSNEVSQITTNTEILSKLNSDFDINKVLQITNDDINGLNSNEVSENINNKIYDSSNETSQMTNNEITDSNNNVISQISDIDSSQISKKSSVDDLNAVTISSNINSSEISMEIDSKANDIEKKLNIIEGKLNQIIITNNSSKKGSSEQSSKEMIKEEDKSLGKQNENNLSELKSNKEIEKNKSNSLELISNKEIEKNGNNSLELISNKEIEKNENNSLELMLNKEIEKNENKNKNKTSNSKKRNKNDEEIKPKKSVSKSRVGRKKSTEINNKSISNETILKDSHDESTTSQEKVKALPRRRRSSSSSAVKKSNSTRGRKPKSSSIKNSAKTVESKKSGTLDEYFNK